jgi:N-acylneuraminate cytidylyltransferase
MNLLQTSGADALLPVVQFSYPPLRGLEIQNDFLQMRWPENIRARSQDLPPLYHDSGQFYLLRTEAFLAEKTLFCKKTIPMIISELEVQDIDNEDDWKLAELKYTLMIERND